MWNRYLPPFILGLALAMPACATTPNAVAAIKVPVPRVKPEGIKTLTHAQTQARLARFNAWKADFTARAIAKGYPPALVRSIVEPTKINARALAREKTQPEFTSPIWTYVEKTNSPVRLNNGKAKIAKHAQLFEKINRRYAVDRNVLTAIWGLESGYGKIMGDHDIPSSLATFAFEGSRTKFGEAQLFAVLDILRSGEVRRGQLNGSWASAMGMTQFIPATFRDYAVDFNGDGNKDLWKSEADALGSAAHYLAKHGWVGGAPIFTEVRLPKGFDFAHADGDNRTVSQWSALGVKPQSGQNWLQSAQAVDAKLFVPAGVNGPALLTYKNFDVIMTYNKSTSYALGIGVLAGALQGSGGAKITQPWPKSDKRVGRTDLIKMQEKLTKLGYDTKGADGVIGPNSRKAVQAWQAAHHLPADGYIERRLFNKIMAAR